MLNPRNDVPAILHHPSKCFVETAFSNLFEGYAGRASSYVACNSLELVNTEVSMLIKELLFLHPEPAATCVVEEIFILFGDIGRHMSRLKSMIRSTGA